MAGTRHQDRLNFWPSVAKWPWLWADCSACHLLSRWYLARLIRPWRWRRYVPPKCRLTYILLRNHQCDTLQSYTTVAVWRDYVDTQWTWDDAGETLWRGYHPLIAPGRTEWSVRNADRQPDPRSAHARLVATGLWSYSAYPDEIWDRRCTVTGTWILLLSFVSAPSCSCTSSVNCSLSKRELMQFVLWSVGLWVFGWVGDSVSQSVGGSVDTAVTIQWS
jgi:hypothetical protein